MMSTGVTLSQKDQAVTNQVPLYLYFSLDIWLDFPLRLSKAQNSQLTTCRQDCLCHSIKMAGKVRVTVVLLQIQQVQRRRKLGNWKTFVPGKSMPEIFQILSPTQFLTFSPYFKFTFQIFLFSLKLMCLSSYFPDYHSPKCFNISCSFYRMSSLSLIQPGLCNSQTFHATNKFWGK